MFKKRIIIAIALMFATTNFTHGFTSALHVTHPPITQIMSNIASGLYSYAIDNKVKTGIAALAIGTLLVPKSRRIIANTLARLLLELGLRFNSPRCLRWSARLDEQINPPPDLWCHPDTTPLHYYAHRGNTKAVRTLVLGGAEIDALDGGSDTPLFAATSKGHHKTVQALIQLGARTDICASLGAPTPLHEAANQGHIETVRILIAGGAALNAWASYIYNYTPLEVAVRARHPEIVRALIAGGAEVDSIRLLLGIHFGHTKTRQAFIQTIQTLIQLGVDVLTHISNNHELLTKNPALRTYLEHVDDYTNDLFRGIQEGNIETVQQAIRNGAIIVGTDEHGYSPLFYAIGAYQHEPTVHDEIARILIQHGGRAVTRAKDRHGRTALHYAVQYGNVRLVMLLLNHGSLVNEQDKNGETPLHYINETPQYQLIVKLLMRNGASPSLRNYPDVALQPHYWSIWLASR